MKWYQRFVAWLAKVVAVPVGRDDDGVNRPLLMAGTELDRSWSELYSDLTDSLEAWRRNPLARRIVGLISSYVVGGGITVSSNYRPLQRFVVGFWEHRKNRIASREEDWCDELTRSGELFLALFLNPHDGMSYVRAIPASRIDSVRSKDGDYETELAYHEVGDSDNPAGTWWLSPDGLELEGEDKTRPMMLHYAINRPVGTVRGEGDLVPILPWLRRYNRWLEDRVRLNAAVRAFLWVIYAPKRLVADLRERYRRPPDAGSVIVAEEGAERWEAVAPTLQARDAVADGRAIRWMIAAGGPGIGLVDLGEGEDANLATARAMGELRRRFLRSRQAYMAFILADVTVQAYNRAVRLGLWRGRKKGLGDLVVDVPDISPEDNSELAKAASDMVGALLDLADLVGNSAAFRAVAVRLFAKFAGESLSDQELTGILEGSEDVFTDEEVSGG